MIVSELISELRKYPKYAQVVFSDGPNWSTLVEEIRMGNEGECAEHGSEDLVVLSP